MGHPGSCKNISIVSSLRLLGTWGVSFINVKGLTSTFDVLAQYNCHPRVELLPLIIIHQNTFLCLKNILKYILNTLKNTLTANYFFCGKTRKLFEGSGKILANLTILILPCLGMTQNDCYGISLSSSSWIFFLPPFSKSAFHPSPCGASSPGCCCVMEKDIVLLLVI